MQDTSRAAYQAIKPHLTTIRDQVYAELRKAKKGLTDEQLSDRLVMLNPSSVRTRRRELADAGVVWADGESRTSSNRRAIVWKAAV